MKILYIYRNPKSGFSIGRVFAPIEQEMKNNANVDSLYLLSPRAGIIDLIANLIFVKKYLKRHSYDIIHITGDVHYIALITNKAKTIVTVHDIGYYTNHKFSFHHIIRYALWMLPLKYIAHVTFISKKSLVEFNNVIKLKPTNQTFIPDPVQSTFIYTPKTFNKEYPTILQVGTQPNKNLEGTIRALKGIPCMLVIVGKLNDNQKKLLEENDVQYKNLYKISDEELIQQYKNCDIVSFPTFYEGFGMPIIEAQAIGRPVVTSDIAPMNEIAGNNSVKINPYDIDSIREGFNRCFNEYDNIVQSGLKNVKRYRADIIAEQYYSIYKKISTNL